MLKDVFGSIDSVHYNDSSQASPSHWPLPDWKALDLAPWLRNDTSSSPRRRIWRPRCTDALQVCRMSNPGANSFAILATNTNTFSEYRPRVNVKTAPCFRLFYGPSNEDVSHNGHHIRPGVDGHKAWFSPT